MYLLCDPELIKVRNPIMVTNTSLLTLSGAPAVLRSYGVSKASGAKRPITFDLKEVTVTPRTKPDRLAWVNHLALIRDQKDRAAFAEVFVHFAPRVKAFLMKSGTSPDMAEEVAQDVMATLWRKAHLFDPAKASVSTWIFTIARNRRIDMLRKQRRPEPEDLTWGPESEPDQVDVLALQQDSAKLSEALADLPNKQKDLIVRAYYGELTHSEIAEATGLPLGTIKSRIRLALNRLRHQMK